MISDVATSEKAAGTLGILAGAGRLPGLVAAAAEAAGRDVFLIGFEDFAEAEVLAPFPHGWARLGAAGRILDLLRGRNCRDLVLIGPVRRPSLNQIRPDAEGLRLLARLGRAIFGGDDQLLSAIAEAFAKEGFHVIGAHQILTGLLAPAGRLGAFAPTKQAEADIAQGVAVVRALGAVDVGQAAVVQQGIVLAVEAAEGTDAMLARCGGLIRPGLHGVLIKLVKPGQDRRFDLPTIGARTVAAAAAAGLGGIAFEAGGTILPDRQAAITAADGAGLFLFGLDPERLG